MKYILCLTLLISIVYGATVNTSGTGVQFDNEFNIGCSQQSITQLDYTIQSDKDNYTVEVLGVVNGGIQTFSNYCGQRCTKTYVQPMSNCLVKITYPGTLTISYIITETYILNNPSQSASPDNGLSPGAIAGIVIGCILGLALLIAAAVFLTMYCTLCAMCSDDD